MRRTFKEYEAMWEDAAANSVADYLQMQWGNKHYLEEKRKPRYMMVELKRVRSL